MRGALVGAMVMAGFGGVWGMWGASGLPTAAAAGLGIASLLAALVVIGLALRLRRTAPPGGENYATDTSYWVITGVEGVAILVGNVLLNATGHGGYAVVWTSLVVGAHFLVFGRRFAAVFTPIGAAVVAAALAGLALGLLGAGDSTVLAVTGLGTAVVLLAAAANAVRWVGSQRVG